MQIAAVGETGSSASTCCYRENRVRGFRTLRPAPRRSRRRENSRIALKKRHASTTRSRRGHGTTQYLYGNLSQPFQVTASRAPDNVLTVYYYDEYGALYALERGVERARYYVGSDHLGTPKMVTDNTGTIVRQLEYDSWGVKVSDTNPSFDLSVGFAGGISDDVTGLVRFGFRDYEPGTGRWAAKDPIFFRGGQANLFSYTFNDPVNFVDPSGLDPRGRNGGTNQVTACHVNPHNDPRENAADALFVLAPLATPYAELALDAVTAWVLTSPQAALDFVSAIPPATSPAPNWYGFGGYLTGTAIDKARKRQ